MLALVKILSMVNWLRLKVTPGILLGAMSGRTVANCDIVGIKCMTVGAVGEVIL